jgi:hypothetical protein
MSSRAEQVNRSLVSSGLPEVIVAAVRQGRPALEVGRIGGQPPCPSPPLRRSSEWVVGSSAYVCVPDV